tara:strand:+ start:9208 stop:9450 length:243 start_codon:yes stop_codon:yes gene_type:complete
MEKKKMPNGEWRIKEAEFKGYVRAKLEDNDQVHTDFNEQLKIIRKDLSDIKKSVNGIQIKTAGLAGVVSIIIALVINTIL